jgi:GntR family transcriptional regulator/MocR family aminotransferase
VPSNQSNRVTGLLVTWDPDGDGPAHQRLAAALRAQVNDGRLIPGERLPPSRILADDLGLSRWVVTEAYDQLKAEGYLRARVGSGTVVAGRPLPQAAADRPPGSGPPPLDVPAALGMTDLSPALPDLSSFPRTAWRAALTKALATAGDAELGYPDPIGSPVLRATTAAYLRRVRGLDPAPERLHVTQGVRNAVALLCRALRAGGARRVAVEDPCWPRLRDIARGAGLDAVPVPVDGDGMRVGLLHGLDVDAVFVTPTHQFPAGVPLSASRRLALVEWADAPGRLVVEDDYDAEFRYDRRPVGALAALAPGRVVYLGSASKTLSPALHLGWMVAPDHLDEPLAAARDGIGTLAPTPDQLALAHLISSGAFDRHLRRMRRLYRRRRTAMLAALSGALPGAVAAGMDAGVHVLWRLPDGTDEAGVLARARSRGLTLLGLSECRVGPGGPALVLGYGNVPEHRALAGARALADALPAPTPR